MRREMIIFAHRHTHNQAENSITEAHSNPLWSVDSRGAGQYSALQCSKFELMIITSVKLMSLRRSSSLIVISFTKVTSGSAKSHQNTNVDRTQISVHHF